MGIILEYCPIPLYPSPATQIQLPLITESRNEHIITFDDFEIEGKLGEGGFGVVFLGQLKKNIERGIVQKFAIKMVSKKKLREHKVVQNAFNQKIIAMYNYSFIVSLIMSFQDQWSIYFILQYASGGDTYSLIKKSSPKYEEYTKLGEPAVRFIAGCVILGLQYVHKNEYLYRDLKPQNVMIFEDGYVKISDFGLAKKNIQGKNNKTILGTRFYYPPEMVLRKGYDKKADLWALGVYLYEMSSYQIPFDVQLITPQKFQSVCRQSESDRRWKNPQISDQLKDLIDNLLRFEPNSRIGARSWEQIKTHPFFKDFNWKQLESKKLQSPLKDIVKNHPTKVKQYRPQLYIKNSNQRPKIQGWSYYGKYAQPN